MNKRTIRTCKAQHELLYLVDISSQSHDTRWKKSARKVQTPLTLLKFGQTQYKIERTQLLLKKSLFIVYAL